MTVIVGWIILIFITLQRIGELLWSHRNTKRLLALGAREYFPHHYWMIVTLHVSWLIMLFYKLSSVSYLLINWFFVGVFVVLTVFRLWVLISLGTYFTTRIISLHTDPLVKSGPYRWLKHPNYQVVKLEIICVPLIFGWWDIAILWGTLNFLILWHRVRREEEALEPRKRLLFEA